jgi:hypothetical protein
VSGGAIEIASFRVRGYEGPEAVLSDFMVVSPRNWKHMLWSVDPKRLARKQRMAERNTRRAMRRAPLSLDVSKYSGDALREIRKRTHNFLGEIQR